MKKNKSLIYIDGGEGSTGLTIKQLINSNSDLEILDLPAKKRKDIDEKIKIIEKANLVVLCLPDSESVKMAKLIKGNTKIIDVSSAHRLEKDWCYGLAEIDPQQRHWIKNSYRVANPGCYPTGFLLLIKPLIVKDIINPQQFISYQAISGYSGGGKRSVDFYNQHQKDSHAARSYSARYYGILQDHKHIKEMQHYSGLTQNPHFLPIIANFKQGMVGHIPLNAGFIKNKISPQQIVEIYQQYYKDEKLIIVHDSAYNTEYMREDLKTIAPDYMAHSNKVEIIIAGNQKNFSLFARYDNLGKGSSGNALQNINLMLGHSEYNCVV